MTKKDVPLNENFVSEARACAEAENRSVSDQIEHWAKIGKTMVDNPELSYDFVRESKLAAEEAEKGQLKPYQRRTPKD